jgi:Outer membrane protein beta-barrel domain
LAALVLALPVGAAAQDFGVMNSAETINKGNFKLTGYPMVVFGKNNADNQTGVAVAGGYGFTDRFDVEAKVAVFDGLTYLGADAEYWLVKGEGIDFSVAGGFHVGNTDFSDTTGLDLTLLASRKVAERLELYGALDIARNMIKDIDFDFTTVHVVPGVEYRITPRVDFVGEVGLGLNDNSSHYASIGFAFYFGTR